MSSKKNVSSNAPTQFLELKGGMRYAYRRFGSGPGLPLLLLQHFTGTLDNWDSALTDALAADRDLLLFDNAGVGRSSGEVPTTAQAAGAAYVERLGERKQDLDGISGPAVANAQMAAFRVWERHSGKRFADLETIRHPTLVVNGVHDEMIPVINSYWLGDHLPNAVLLTYPDAGHGSLFQYHESFARHANAFLSVTSQSAVY